MGVQDRDELLGVAAAGVHIVEAFVVDEMVEAHDAAECGPILGQQVGEGEPLPVAAGVVVPESVPGLAPVHARPALPDERVDADRPVLEPHAGAQVGDVDHLPLAGALPRVEGGEDAVREERRSADIAGGAGVVEGRIFIGAGAPHHAGARLPGVVVAGTAAERTAWNQRRWRPRR